MYDNRVNSANSVGVIFPVSKLLKNGAEELLSLGAECVQLNCWDTALMTAENAEIIKETLRGKARISSLWTGWSGPAVWDSVDGPHTLGLVPPAYRFIRMKELCVGADFALMLGVPNIATHVGFIPEQPSFSEYRGVVQAVKFVSGYCRERGLGFNFETGQETPVTLMRTIADVGNDNVGINLDPANLIMYGRGNPVDALDIFKGYIRGVHIKDGDYPTDFYKLGQERPVGEGSVNFPVFLPKLLAQGYTGDLYIEREIDGERRIRDIKAAMRYVEGLTNV
jgi:hypothetical protein